MTAFINKNIADNESLTIDIPIEFRSHNINIIMTSAEELQNEYLFNFTPVEINSKNAGSRMILEERL
jgi:hypothetical protein